MQGNTFIYMLVEPETFLVRYIGKSNNPNYRYNSHYSEKLKIKENGKYLPNRKISWIKSLKTKGLKPELVVIDKVSNKEWQFWETYYISLYRSWGFDLVNVRDGGCGHDGLRGDNNPAKRPEVREKISKAKLGSKNAMYGKTNSTTWKMGHKPWNQGLTEETSKSLKLRSEIKKNVKENLHKPVLQFNLQGNLIKEWDSMLKASQEYNISTYIICKYCLGKINILKKCKEHKLKHRFTWKFKNK